MLKNIRRVAVVAVLGVTPIVATTTAARAGGAPDDYKYYAADAEWQVRGPVPGGLPGNVHRGALRAVADLTNAGVNEATGTIEAWTCPKGVQPPPLNAVTYPDAPPTRCTFEGVRYLSFRSPAVKVNPHLASASIVGTATATDPTGVRPPARVQVEMSLTASAPPVRQISITQEVEPDGTRVTRRLTSIERLSTLTGTVGHATLGDARSDVTTSTISSQQQTTPRS